MTVGVHAPGTSTDPAADPGDTGSAVAPGARSPEPVNAPGLPVIDSPAECNQYNLSNELHDHHIFPQTCRGEFSRIGIEPDDFTITITIPGDQHIGKDGIHTVFDWNGEWQDFLDQIPIGPLTQAAGCSMRPLLGNRWSAAARVPGPQFRDDGGAFVARYSAGGDSANRCCRSGDRCHRPVARQMPELLDDCGHRASGNHITPRRDVSRGYRVGWRSGARCRPGLGRG